MVDINTKYGYIFKVTNVINNKIYVSKKVSDVFDPFYYGNGIKFKKALNEFGVNNFKVELLERCSTKDILKVKEKYWIDFLNSRNPIYGYNSTPGGESDTRDYSNSMTNKGATVISLQIPTDFYNRLKEKAKEECTTVSFLVRRMIIKDIREGEENEQ